MKRKCIRFVLAGLLLVLIVIIALLFVPVSPHGRFSVPAIGSTGDAYWELVNGKITLVVFDGERDREGKEERQFISDYAKVDGRWVATSSSNRPTELHATMLALTLVESDGSRVGPFYRYEVFGMSRVGNVHAWLPKVRE